jgi:hypothetical protein
VWTPAADLETTNDTPLGYGLQIIDDVTGQYQYSTQFGIKAGNCKEVVSSSSSVAPVISTSAAAGYGYSVASSSAVVATSTPTPESSKVYQTIAPYPTTVVVMSSAVVLSTGTPSAGNSMTVPSSLLPGATNATTSRLPEATTNAGSSVQAGLSFAGALAALAYLL